MLQPDTMGTARWVCLDADDLMHENTGESNYNESAYYNFYDPAQRLGGFVRIGNRPNEGYAEMTLCLYLPDGTVGFMFGRPKIPDNARFDAGGMRFEVRAPMRRAPHPLRRHRVPAGAPARPARSARGVHAEPARAGARRARPTRALSPAHGGELREERDGRWVSVRAERPGQEFARGHLEQHGHATGRVIVVGDRRWTIDGYGLRDRSWGPRYWQAPRLLSLAHDELRPRRRHRGGAHRAARRHAGAGRLRLRAAASRTARSAGSRSRATTPARSSSTGDCAARLHPADGGPRRGDHAAACSTWCRSATGANGVTTRIAEGLTEWQWGGRVGYGWSEFLDHVD